MRTDPQVSNVLGKDNLDSTFDQRFSFHHGHVDQVIMSPQDLDDAGITIAPESVDSVSQLIVFTPSNGDDEGFKKYLEVILADINRMSLRLNSNHKKMFLNRYPINKIMELKI